MVINGYVPDRGELIWLDFTPQAGHEQAGRRPALVLSPALYNRASGLALVCPITTKDKGYPFNVPLPQGLDVSGVVLSDQLRSLEWKQRHATLIARASQNTMDEVLKRFKPLLCL